MCGLRSDDAGSHYGLYVFGLYLVRLMGGGFVEAVTAISPTADAATQLSGTIPLPFCLLTLITFALTCLIAR